MNGQIAEMMGWDESDLGARPHSSEFHWVKTATNGVREFVASSDDANFTESLDACFKWVVPWLIKQGYKIDISCDAVHYTSGNVRPDYTVTITGFDGRKYSGDAITLSEAFCKAVLMARLQKKEDTNHDT